MTRVISVCLIVLCFCTLAVAQKGKSVSLMNGKDLTGWEVAGTEKWYVEKGEIVCESGPDKEYGYLATKKEFKDFELLVEFKQESNGNSGVFFHCSLDGTKISGWQAEVAPMGHSTGGIYESYGRGWLIKPDSAKDKTLKEGEWNTMKVKVVGGHVETWLNNVPMITLTDELIGSRTGKIALQIHAGGGVKVRWKQVKITEL